MRRTLLIVLATVVFIVAAGSLALLVGPGPAPNAALVNATPIPNQQVTSDINTVVNNHPYLCYLNAATLVRTSGSSGLGSVTGSKPNTWSPSFVASWLDQEITAEVVAQENAKLGIPAPSATDLALAKADLIGSMDSTLSQVASTAYACPTSATAILDSMPADFVQRQVLAQANSEALLAHEGGVALDDQSLRRYFEENRSHFDTVCVSGILLGNQATASSVRTQLEGGANFADVAAFASQDASRTKGGALGCFTPGSANYQSVQTDVGSLAVGQITQPLASQNGKYVLLKVTSRTPSTYESVRSVVRRTALGVDASRVSQQANNLVKNANIWIDPTYGTWNASKGGVIPTTTPIPAVVGG